MSCWSEFATRSRRVHVYSLSTAGAFLETPRPSIRGAGLTLEILLPDGVLRVTGRVIYSNVPGNLQRPMLPLGMGVQFEELDEEATARLRRYVENRFAQISV